MLPLIAVRAEVYDAEPSNGKPYIFYNTWNFQERNKWWNGRPYLESMNEDRILKEIDVAHRMGVDVFVLDTGWYEKTGDWTVSSKRFPGRLENGQGKAGRLWHEARVYGLAYDRGCIQPGGARTP